MEFTRRGFMGAMGAAAVASATAGGTVFAEEAKPSDGVFGNMDAYDIDCQRWIEDLPECSDLVLDDGTVIPAVYVKLRLYITRLANGAGDTPRNDKEAWDYLIHNFTEEEAELYLTFPAFEWFMAVDVAARRPDDPRTEADYAVILDDLAARGLIVRAMRNGRAHYRVECMVSGGIFEIVLVFGVDAEDEYQRIEDMVNFVGTDFSLFNTSTSITHMLPVSSECTDDGELLPYDDWRAMIERNDVIAVCPCQCHRGRMVNPDAMDRFVPGVADCDHPLETCLSFGDHARYYLENNHAREISKEEAIAVIERAIDLGAVIDSEYSRTGEIICCCWRDHCITLGTLSSVDEWGEDLNNTISNYQLVLDKDKCIQCGTCIDRCTMGIVYFGEDGYPEVENKCLRCGQCVLGCPADARKLVARPVEERIPLPFDIIGDMNAKTYSRVRFGNIVDFVG